VAHHSAADLHMTTLTDVDDQRGVNDTRSMASRRSRKNSPVVMLGSLKERMVLEMVSLFERLYWPTSTSPVADGSIRFREGCEGLGDVHSIQ